MKTTEGTGFRAFRRGCVVSAANPWLHVTTLLLSLALSACGDEWRSESAARPLELHEELAKGPGPRRQSFVVVLIDTLRADHLSLYGYERATTPFLEALGARGMVFERAVAQAPWTAPSMATLWTSRYPEETGVRARAEGEARHLDLHGATELRRGLPTLSEMLDEAGYLTYAGVGNIYASGPVKMLRGFGRVARHRAVAGAHVVVRSGIRWLRNRVVEAGPKQPFLVYLHLMDVHEPTNPPRRWERRFEEEPHPHERRHYRWSCTARDVDVESEECLEYRRHKIALYDGALAFVDSQIRRLHRALERMELRDDVVTIVVADHGEEFWDHRAFEAETLVDPRDIAGVGHGHAMFDESLHVPLIMSGGEVPTGRFERQVRLLDVAPTVLAMAEIDPGDVTFRGVDLLEHVARRPEEDLPAYSESIAYGPEAKSLRRGGWQYLEVERTLIDRRSFLFRVGESPVTDRSEQRPELVRQMRDELREFVAISEKAADRERPPDERAMELDAETARALAALGYAEEALNREASGSSDEDPETDSVR